jgi:flagellar motility protein MotE (MotC chaperone)
MAKTAVKRSITPASVRLIPAVMAALAALLGLKAVAMAEVVGDVAAHAGNSQQQQANGGAPPNGENAQGAAAGGASCPSPSFAEMAGLSQSEVQVLQALGARRQELDARASTMDTQGELMTAAEHRLDDRITQLRQLETQVNTLLGQLDEAQATRINNLVDVYQRMRAKDAATVFDGLDDGVLVQVASRMRQANLAEVMGKMDPVRARRLTQMLAEMSRPPTDGQQLLDRARGGASTPAPAAR